MTNPNEPTQTQRQAIADFDRAYADFSQAFAEVPDEALTYLPEGDEYVLGVLPIHLANPIPYYVTVLDRIETAGFGPLDLTAEPEWPERVAQRARLHAEVVALRPVAAERAPMLADLDAAHQAARQRFAACDPATFGRTASVVYEVGADAYPTSGHAIAGWLADHYREHTAQTRQMLARWHATSG